MELPVKIPCPNCAAPLKVKDEALFGKKVKCPACGTPFTVERPVVTEPKPEPVAEPEPDIYAIAEEPVAPPPLPKKRPKSKEGGENESGGGKSKKKSKSSESRSWGEYVGIAVAAGETIGWWARLTHNIGRMIAIIVFGSALLSLMCCCGISFFFSRGGSPPRPGPVAQQQNSVPPSAPGASGNSAPPAGTNPATANQPPATVLPPLPDAQVEIVTLGKVQAGDTVLNHPYQTGLESHILTVVRDQPREEDRSSRIEREIGFFWNWQGQSHGAHVSEDGRSVVFDGQPGPPFDALYGPLRIVKTEAGPKLAYVARVGDHLQLFLDQQPGPEFDGIEARGDEDYQFWEHPGDVSWHTAGVQLIHHLGYERFAFIVNTGFQEGVKKYSADPDSVQNRVETRIRMPDGRSKQVTYDASCLHVQLLVDGQLGPPLKEILFEGSGERSSSCNSPLFASNGRHYAYSGVIGDDQSQLEHVLIFDGKPIARTRDGTLTDWAFSPDGERFAYVIPEENGQRVVVDGKAGEKYNDVEQLQFSPDSQHWLYRAVRGKQQFLIVDGESQELAGVAVFWRYSPDGKRFAVRVLENPGQVPAKHVLVLDGQTIGPCRADYDFIHFSPDSSRYAFVKDAVGQQAVIVDGVEGKPYPAVRDFRFSSDGKHFGYTAQLSDTQARVVVDGQEGPVYGSVGPVDFFGDHWYHTALISEDKWMMVVDGQPGKTSEVWFPGDRGNDFLMMTFSPDRTRYAYLARGSQADRIWSRVILDGVEGPSFSGNNIAECCSLKFSEDGQHFGYLVNTEAHGEETRKSYIVVDGKPTPIEGYALIMSPNLERWISQRGAELIVDGQPMPAPKDLRLGSVEFTPDSRHYSFEMSKRLVLDGRIGPEFNDLYVPLLEDGKTPHGRRIVDPDGKIRYFARQGDTIVAVTQSGQAATGKNPTE